MKKQVGGLDSVGKRIFKVAVSTVVFIGDWLWLHLRQVAGPKLPGTCVVLYYHAVPGDQRANFARQMDVLLRLCKPVKSESTEPLGNGYHVAVVFHDAFVSVCDNALPELAKRGIHSTVFVPSGFLGQRQGWIKDSTHSDYQELVVDAARLKSFDEALVSIGSHTVTHANLSLLNEDAARDQLRRSKVELEAILGRPVNQFAFPYGGCTDALTELAREVGYRRVFTIQPELALLKPDEFITGSCPASPSDWGLEFRLKLLGAYRWLPSLYSMKRKLLFGAQRRKKRDGSASIENGRTLQGTDSPNSAKTPEAKIWQEPGRRY